MGRANKRGGFGVLRGATNNRSGITPIAPNNPNHLDRWVNKDTNQEYYWNKPTTEWIPLFGAGGGGNLGGLVYHNDTNTTAVTTNVEVGTVDVTMSFDGSLVVTGTFVGTASAAATLTTLVKLDTVTQHTIVDYATGATDYTVNFSLVLEGVVAGDYTVSVDMAASAGTFTLDASEQHLYCLTYYDAVIGGSGGATTTGYIFGGLSSSTTPISDTDEYTSDTWTSKTNMNNTIRRLSSSIISSKIYAYAGFRTQLDNSDTLDTEEYSPDTWTSKTNCPSPARGVLSASTISSKGYIYCGYDGASDLQDTDEYTPDTWTSKTNCPSPARQLDSANTIDSKGYIYCGGGSSGRLQDTDEYTPDTWTSKTNCPSPARNANSIFTVNSKGYITCGASPTILQDTDEYTPDTWVSKTSCPTPARFSHISISISSNGYNIGGYAGAGYFTDNDEYDSDGDSWTAKTNLISPARQSLQGDSL